MAIVGYQAEVEKILAKIADIKVQLPLPGRIASGGCGTAMRRCARRQYDAVDPSNRLVAAELERRWNQALTTEAQLGDAKQ